MTEFRKTRRVQSLLEASYLGSPFKIICMRHQRSRSTYDYLDSSTFGSRHHPHLVSSTKNRERSPRNSLRNGDALSPYQRRGRSDHLWVHHSVLNIEDRIRTTWNRSEHFLSDFRILRSARLVQKIGCNSFWADSWRVSSKMQRSLSQLTSFWLNPSPLRLSVRSPDQPNNFPSHKAYGWSQSSMIGLADSYDSAWVGRLFRWTVRYAKLNSTGTAAQIRPFPPAPLRYEIICPQTKFWASSPQNLVRRVASLKIHCAHQWSVSGHVLQGYDPLSIPIYGDAADRTDPTTVDELRGVGPLEASAGVFLLYRSHPPQLGSLAL